MVLRLKEKELAAVGISVVAGCKPCTDHDVPAARKAGASDDEIKQAIAEALAVRRSATEIMEGYRPDPSCSSSFSWRAVNELLNVFRNLLGRYAMGVYKPRWHETFACREAGIVNS